MPSDSQGGQAPGAEQDIANEISGLPQCGPAADVVRQKIEEGQEEDRCRGQAQQDSPEVGELLGEEVLHPVPSHDAVALGSRRPSHHFPSQPRPPLASGCTSRHGRPALRAMRRCLTEAQRISAYCRKGRKLSLRAR